MMEVYSFLLKNLPFPPPSRLWEKIWNKDGLLKAQYFMLETDAWENINSGKP